jgi:hypothetical protein
MADNRKIKPNFKISVSIRYYLLERIGSSKYYIFNLFILFMNNNLNKFIPDKTVITGLGQGYT